MWDAVVEMLEDGVLPPERPPPVSAELADGYRRVGAMYAAGKVAAAGDGLAMNFLLDRSAEGWKRDLERLKSVVGEYLDRVLPDFDSTTKGNSKAAAR